MTTVRVARELNRDPSRVPLGPRDEPENRRSPPAAPPQKTVSPEAMAADLKALRMQVDAALSKGPSTADLMKEAQTSAMKGLKTEFVGTMTELCTEQRKELEKRAEKIATLRHEKEELSTQAEAERKQREALQRDCDKLTSGAGAERDELNRLRAAEASWQQAGAVAQAAAADWAEARVMLEATHAKAVQKHDAAAKQARAALAEERARAATERGQLEETLQAERGQREAEAAKAAEAVAQAAAAEERVAASSAASNEVDHVRAAEAAEAAAASQQAAEAQQALRQQLADTEAQLACATERAERLGDAISAKSGEVENGQAALREANAALDAATARAVAAETARDEMTTAAKRAADAASKELHDLRGKLSQAEKAIKDGAEGIARLGSERADADARGREALAAAEAARKQAEEEAAAREVRLRSDLESKLASATSDAADKLRAAEAARDAALQLVDSSREEAEALRAQLKDAQYKGATAEGARAAADAGRQTAEKAHAAEAAARCSADAALQASEVGAKRAAVEASKQLGDAAKLQREAQERCKKSEAEVYELQKRMKNARTENEQLQKCLDAADKSLVDERKSSSSMAKKLVHDLEDRIKSVGEREQGMSHAMEKVMAAEEAMEASLTCYACVKTLVEPRTCTPCGHTFCAACLKCEMGAGGEHLMAACPECNGQPGRVLTVKQLSTCVSKFAYQRQTLAELQVGAATAAAACRMANNARSKAAQARGGTMPLTNGGVLAAGPSAVNVS